MKKILLSLSVVLMGSVAVYAQDKHEKVAQTHPVAVEKMAVATTPPPAQASSLKPENLAFKAESHDFGTVPEGPAAEYEFTFKNTGKEPILLQEVKASCGCTTPSYSKEPVKPGQTGSVKASFASAGRPGPFTKTITVTSNAGVKVLTIKGTVEKAPESSVPENTSMIKTR